MVWGVGVLLVRCVCVCVCVRVCVCGSKEFILTLPSGFDWYLFLFLTEKNTKETVWFLCLNDVLLSESFYHTVSRVDINELLEIWKKKCVSDIVISYTTNQSPIESRYFSEKRTLLFSYILSLKIVQIDLKSRKYRSKMCFCRKFARLLSCKEFLVCQSAKLEVFSDYAVDFMLDHNHANGHNGTFCS